MHMPKSNTFAYVCCMLLGVVFIYLGATGRFQDALGNIILAGVGVLMIIGYAIVIYRHLKEKKEQEKYPWQRLCGKTKLPAGRT